VKPSRGNGWGNELSKKGPPLTLVDAPASRALHILSGAFFLQTGQIWLNNGGGGIRTLVRGINP
jgi:hypothetical protein